MSRFDIRWGGQMITRLSIVKRFVAAYVAQYQPLPSQLQALGAFKCCLTQLAPHMVAHSAATTTAGPST